MSSRPRPIPDLPAPLAKLSPPRVASAVARPRLFKLLDRGSRRPVTWVEGPAGSGKTTLAASWLARRGLRHLWYRVDARDADPATFFYCLGEGVRRLAPGRGATLPALAPEHLDALEVYGRNFFDAVFARLGTPAVLVLDDLHELADGAALRRILAAVLGALPEGLHVLALSRAAPGPEMSRLRANSLLSTVGWDALRFTDREATALLAGHGLPRPGAGALAGLYEQADGWAAGLVLLGQAARRGDRWDGAGRRPAELIEYFKNELFERAAPAVQRLLLATAPLPAITAEIAEQLAGPGAGAHLERLARENFFTTQRSGGDPVYEYHPLFREFLRARADAVLAPEERARLRRRAAALLDQARHPEDALALLQEAGDGAAAGALVARLAPALAAQGRLQTLEAAIRGLPQDVRDGDPWLLHWLGVCRVLASPSEGLALAERAFAVFEARGDDAGCLTAWTGIVNAVFLAWKDFALIDRCVAWLEARMRRTPGFPTPGLAARVTASMVECLLWRDPSHPDLPAWAGRLAAMVDRIESPGSRARALMPLVWYRGWTGDLAGLAAATDRMERAFRMPAVPVETRIFCLELGAIAASWAAFDPDRALAYTHEALRLAGAEGVHAHDRLMHALAAMAHLVRRDVAAADPHLEAIRGAASAGAVTTEGIHLQAFAWRALLAGDLDGALALAERALEVAETCGFAVKRIQFRYQLAQIHHARGDAVQAARHLAVAEEAAEAARAAVLRWACRLMRAQLALDAGEQDAGRALLAGALAEGRERGFTSVPSWSSDLALSGLCAEALEAGIEPEYAGRLVAVHDLTPDPSRAGAERWPYALRVNALGPVAVHRADRRGGGQAAVRGKPLQLLEVLVALGGRDVPATRVVDLLWPDAEGDRARQNLRFTLHSLRRVLGGEALLAFEGGLLSLDRRRVWVDVWELDRQLARLAAAVERGRLEEAADALARALALHRRPLLEGERAPWAAAARERLAGRLRRLALDAARALEEKDPAAVARSLERAVEQLPDDGRLAQALARARGRAAASSHE